MSILNLIKELDRRQWWAQQAACKGHGDLMLPFPAGQMHPTKSQLERERKGQEICATCPVIEECRAYRESLPSDTEGTYAGLTRRDWLNKTTVIAPPPLRLAPVRCDRPGCTNEPEPGARFCSLYCSNNREV